MAELNPYAKFLDGRPIVEILSSSPGRVATLIKTLGAEKQTAAPAPGKWSAAEIVCHLADCEIAFSFRLRQTLAEPGHVVQPFDQDKWASPYGSVSGAEALQTYAALRRWNLALLRWALPAHAGDTVTHPERGAMTFETIVETMAGHDLNHLAQLEKLAG